MAQFNDRLCELILSKCGGLSLAEQVSPRQGRFLADKSYAFDTMFFVARYIRYFRFGDTFSRKHRDREDEYISDLFCLRKGSSQVRNYFIEALALLRFLKAVEYDGRNYRILDDEILDIFSSSFENSYIFLYLLSYAIFHNEGLWDVYTEFCAAPESERQEVYDRYRRMYVTKDPRIKDHSKGWALFTPKYPFVVLNYANRTNMVSRTGTVRDKSVSRRDISLNTKGTRNMYDFPKKNSYLQDMSESYIIETLRPFLVSPPPREPVSYSDTISIDIADTKLRMLADRYHVEVARKSQGSRYKYHNGTKVRTVQSEFRNGLLRKTPHTCPVCGFGYEDFLIASHIRPYAQCDDTYDAMNPNNGLLLCPICDKLFESANLMTIESTTGRIICAEEIKGQKDFLHLQDKAIDYDYIDCERRHYLKWHNDLFHKKHP